MICECCGKDFSFSVWMIHKEQCKAIPEITEEKEAIPESTEEKKRGRPRKE